MQEEIFGPVLPIVTYRDLADAIAFVNARPRPLAALLLRIIRNESETGAHADDLRRRDDQRHAPALRAGRSPVWRRRGERLWRIPRHRGLPRVQSREGGVRRGAMEWRRTVASPVRPTHQLHSELHAPPGPHDLRGTDRGSQRRGDPRVDRTRLGPANRCRTLAVVVARLSVGSTRVTYKCSVGRLPMEGAPGRTAQRRGEERPTAFLRHHRRRDGACTPSAPSRSAPPPTARAPSSSATKPRSDCSHGWDAHSSRRGCMRSTKRCSTT